MVDVEDDIQTEALRGHSHVGLLLLGSFLFSLARFVTLYAGVLIPFRSPLAFVSSASVLAQRFPQIK